jgi:hypothetical protein
MLEEHAGGNQQGASSIVFQVTVHGILIAIG